jgi:hypothetical protein
MNKATCGTNFEEGSGEGACSFLCLLLMPFCIFSSLSLLLIWEGTYLTITLKLSIRLFCQPLPRVETH